MNLDEAIRITDPATRQEALYKYDPEERDSVENEARHMAAQALREKQAGQLIELPFVAMIEQSLQKGKMTPMRDQRFNGRYAVVYFDKKKWKYPLIDICGSHYRRDEAKERLAALAHQQPMPEPQKGE